VVRFHSTVDQTARALPSIDVDVVATSLQALPTESVRITKRLLHRDKPDVLQVIDEESELFRERIHSVEAKEEVARFLK
jgi:hypothetical protein